MKREFSTHWDEVKMGSGSKLMEESIVATLVIFRERGVWILPRTEWKEERKVRFLRARTNLAKKEKRIDEGFIPRECYSRIFKFTREEIGRRKCSATLLMKFYFRPFISNSSSRYTGWIVIRFYFFKYSSLPGEFFPLPRNTWFYRRAKNCSSLSLQRSGNLKLN